MSYNRSKESQAKLTGVPQVDSPQTSTSASHSTTADTIPALVTNISDVSSIGEGTNEASGLAGGEGILL